MLDVVGPQGTRFPQPPELGVPRQVEHPWGALGDQLDPVPIPRKESKAHLPAPKDDTQSCIPTLSPTAPVQALPPLQPLFFRQFKVFC